MSGNLNAIGDEEPRVRVFGPVTVDGHCVTRAQGGILSALALRPGDAFSTEALIHALWPEKVPTSARSSLQNQLTRLRRTFGDDLIETSREGYRLRATTDVQLFETAAGIGCGPDLSPAESVEVLESAIDMWVGEPYGSLMDHSEAHCEVNRLVVLHLGAEECLAAARLVAGQYEAAISQLMVMVDVEPYRERRWELLIRALVDSGRRGEALAAWERMCARFRAELGAMPSDALGRLGEEIRTGSMSRWADASENLSPGTSPDAPAGCAGQIRMRAYRRCSGSYRTHRTRGGAE